MAIPGTLMKLSWGGKLFDTEQWNCSLYVYGVAGITNSTPEGMSPILEGFHSNANAAMSSASRLDYVKYNIIDPITGKYADESVSHSHFLTSPVSGVGQPGPGQLTVCASLTTALQRGRAHSGRIYPPTSLTFATVDASGRMTELAATGLTHEVKLLINEINDTSGAAVVVYSKIGQIVQPVLGTRVGRVIDTQRRRRTSLLEEYVSETLSA